MLSCFFWFGVFVCGRIAAVFNASCSTWTNGLRHYGSGNAGLCVRLAEWRHGPRCGIRILCRCVSPCGRSGKYSQIRGRRLKYNGFAVEVESVRARMKQGGPRHTIFLGVRKRGSERRPLLVSTRQRSTPEPISRASRCVDRSATPSPHPRPSPLPPGQSAALRRYDREPSIGEASAP